MQREHAEPRPPRERAHDHVATRSEPAASQDSHPGEEERPDLRETNHAVRGPPGTEPGGPHPLPSRYRARHSSGTWFELREPVVVQDGETLDAALERAATAGTIVACAPVDALADAERLLSGDLVTYHARYGVREGYPWCCILAFASGRSQWLVPDETSSALNLGCRPCEDCARIEPATGSA